MQFLDVPRCPAPIEHSFVVFEVPAKRSPGGRRCLRAEQISIVSWGKMESVAGEGGLAYPVLEILAHHNTEFTWTNGKICLKEGESFRPCNAGVYRLSDAVLKLLSSGTEELLERGLLRFEEGQLSVYPHVFI